MARKLVVEILGDAASLDRSFKQAGRSTRGFGSEIERAGRGAAVATVGFRGLGRSVAFASGAFLGGAGLVTVLKGAVSAASNLAEQTSKTNVVFGESAAAVEKWAKDTTTSMGLAEDQALATASSFGALFAPLKIIGPEAARQSEALTQLGADLASFYNTDVQDALDAIRSGLVGESEPLRRYGVLLSETRVQQEALNETGKKSAAQLTQQEKVLARIELIFRDSGKAQGDFARTSGGLANQTRILKANLRQLETELGQGIIPGLTEAAKATNSLIVAFKKIPGSGVSGVDIFRGLAKNASAIATATPVIGSLFKTITDKGPNQGWAAFFNSITALAHAGRIAPLDQLEQLRGQRNLDRQAFVNLPEMPLSPTAAQLRAIALEQFGGTGGPQEIAAINAQIAADNAAIKFAQQRIKDRQGNLRAFADELKILYADRNDMFARIAAINADATQKARDAAEKAREARKKYLQHLRAMFKDSPATVSLSEVSINAIIRRALRERRDLNKKLAQQYEVGPGKITDKEREALQFRALGLTATGEALAPTKKALQRGLAQIEKALGGTILDTDKNRNLIARIRRVLSGEFGALNREVRLKIQELEKTLSGDKKTGGPRTPVSALDVSRITRGLDRATALQIQSRLAAAHLTTLAGRPIVIHNEIPVSLDGREIARSVTTHQMRTDQRTPTQSRGRQAR